MKTYGDDGADTDSGPDALSNDSMAQHTDFSEISVLIPGYSVEDLPTDLPEEEAASLLNAIACAWHPSLIRLSSGIPVFRQAESLTGYPGRRIVFVPAASEAWMPHEWRAVFREQGHIVLAGCSKREDWLAAIHAALSGDITDATRSNDQPPETESRSTASSAADTPGQPPVLVEHFLSLGIVMLQVQLLSRRRHHFVDADKILLGREVRLAADASLAGDEDRVRSHLQTCFEHLRDTREKFYPMNCYLIDLCIPGEDETPANLRDLIASTTATSHLNLLATGRDLAIWTENEPSLATELKQASENSTLTVLTGHYDETRPSLGSMDATVTDIERCRKTYESIFGSPPRHWARRRYGMAATMPALLNYFGFESALHMALDDGLYPDKERSQFEWQGPDRSSIPAASRIPLAIDSASGFLRFADRYNESMQDDNTAALFLARLPTLKTPWLQALQIMASYAPVLGEFATIDAFVRVCDGSRLAERFSHADYLAPYLIQSAVLKSEAPISGPATLRSFQQELQSIRNLLALERLVKSESDSGVIIHMIDSLEADLGDVESQQVDTTTMLSQKAAALKAAAEKINQQLKEATNILATALQSRVPNKPGDSRGLFLINTVPFGRLAEVKWPHTWKRPAKSNTIELAERTDSGERLLVKLPPGGFAWLVESNSDRAPHPLLESVPREPPLAEDFTLRNRHFEVTLSDRTGGIAAVSYHKQRGNRLSQQVCFRYERELTLPADADGEVRKSAYATAHVTGHRIVHAGTVFAAIETTCELRSPVEGLVLARFRQITSVDRAQPRIHVRVVFDRIETRVKGNPWLTYFGCRFAWDNEAASVTRSVMGQAAGFRAERFESPDYVEVSDQDHRVVIATHGRPYHRRSGPRMLDSLLIVEGEPARDFEFTIDLDQPFPLRTAVDANTPVCVSETDAIVPAGMSTSWILGLSARNVELVRSTVRPATEDSAEEISLLLAETEGHSVKCLIRTARSPSSAFIVNADRSQKTAAEITSEGVVVRMNSFQLKEVLLLL